MLGRLRARGGGGARCPQGAAAGAEEGPWLGSRGGGGRAARLPPRGLASGSPQSSLTKSTKKIRGKCY